MFLLFSIFLSSFFFFFNDTATTEIYTLSLHDALPTCDAGDRRFIAPSTKPPRCSLAIDRKSTCLNSSHVRISYAVFCLKKKNKKTCFHKIIKKKKKYKQKKQ